MLSHTCIDLVKLVRFVILVGGTALRLCTSVVPSFAHRWRGEPVKIRKWRSLFRGELVCKIYCTVSFHGRFWEALYLSKASIQDILCNILFRVYLFLGILDKIFYYSIWESGYMHLKRSESDMEVINHKIKLNRYKETCSLEM